MPTAPSTCPSCATPLALFTPREAHSHVNACLDAAALSSTLQSTACDRPVCAVCSRDLTALTSAARLEHANRCADTLLPLPPRPTRPRSRGRARAQVTSRNDASNHLAPSTTTTRTTSPPGDPRVHHLLHMLGLQRYAARFAREEIDLVALRLLSDDDLAQLTIPEAARRRIADALHSIPILAQLQAAARSQSHPPNSEHPARDAFDNSNHDTNNHNHHDDDDDDNDAPPVPTQRFRDSRIASRLRRLSPVPLDPDSADEYVPTSASPLLQTSPGPPASLAPAARPAVPSPSRGAPVDGSPALPRAVAPRPSTTGAVSDGLDDSGDDYIPSQLPSPSPVQASARFAAALSNDHGRLRTATTAASPSAMLSDAVSPTSPPSVKALACTDEDHERDDIPMSENISPSSLASDLHDLPAARAATSQISLEERLRRWRHRQIGRERGRHRRAVRAIEERYERAMRRVLGGADGGEDKDRDDGGLCSVKGDDEVEGEDSVACKTSMLPKVPVAPAEISIDLTQDVEDNMQAQVCNGGRNDEAVVCVVSSGESNFSQGEGPYDAQERFPELSRMDEDCSRSDLSAEANATITGGGESFANGDENIFRTPEHANVADGIDDSDCDVLNLMSGEEEKDGNGDAIDSERERSRVMLPRLEFDEDDDEKNNVVDLLSTRKTDGTGSRQGRAVPARAKAVSKAKPPLADGERRRTTKESHTQVSKENGMLDNGNKTQANCDTTGEAETQTQSRLKKKRKSRTTKAGRMDMIKAIKADPIMYDQVLAMESVSFERVLECMKTSGLDVAKKTLFDLLVQEGVSFCGDPSGNSGRPQSQQFFNRLNSDRRIAHD